MDNSNIVSAKWCRELEVFYQLKHSIIFEGNIHDVYQTAEGSWLQLDQYLESFLISKGYPNVVQYNHIDGFTSTTKESLEAFRRITGAGDGRNNAGVGRNGAGPNGSSAGPNGNCARIPAAFAPGETDAPALIKNALTQNAESMVIIMNLASRYIIAPDRLLPEDVQCYTILQQAVLDAKVVNAGNTAQPGNPGEMPRPRLLKNMLIFITDKKNDLPSWFYLNINRIEGIHIEFPTAEQRRNYVELLGFQAFFNPKVYGEDAPNISEDEMNKLKDRFVGRTDGFTFSELNQLRQLCVSQEIRVPKLCSVIDLYNYGIKDNPWESDDLILRLKEGKKSITRRVKGQEEAVEQSLDILKRAVTGLSNFRNPASPKGILFFAGPTGTGKTETAKSLAELVFGDESACIRFDMSEYSQSHSDQKLLGAPPGYVGYEAGGQLTNAVRNNPFSILLFDEIEKANPSILDKFLQILEDGRMTDGQGNTAYFSDSIIIFTSNLGIFKKHPDGTREAIVTRETPPDEARKKIIAAINDYFKYELGRPEILNRIGENIVVFNFITEEIAKEILEARLVTIHDLLKTENGLELSFAPVKNRLLELVCTNLDNGGRGINNIVEKALVNPLARHIFDEQVPADSKKEITDITFINGTYDIVWRDA